MKPLKIGITGVRGIVGETFTPEVAVGFAQAFATYLDSGRMLVCRDTRSSGPMVRSAVTAGLLAAGCEVIDLGICPTPSLQLAVPWSKADGGIAITAGHNPSQWNALKFVRGDGLYLNPQQAEELLDIYHQGEFAKASWNEIQPTIQHQDPIEHHIESLKRVFDVEAIKRRRLKVAVDCCNGACSLVIPRWLAELDCEVLSINDDPNGVFPHRPEPIPETMAQLSALVKAGHADIGFAHDADGERLGIVTEFGEPLSEELTLAVATRYADRIRCALDVVGVSSFITFMEKTEAYRRDLRRVEYGDERDPKMREFFTRIAAVNNVDKITKPLFIVAGQNDPRVPVSEGEQMVAAMKRNGRPVWWLMAKDEGHGFAKKKNQDYQFYATVAFIQQHLLN